MKRAIIVHCWGGQPNYAWYPWAKAQLEAKGYAVSVPQMPDTARPRLELWLPYLQEVVGASDEELVLIGHSIGTVTIMRYLETLTENQRIAQAVLVAAFTDHLGFKELENFFEKPLDYPKIQTKAAAGIVLIQSDDDPYISGQYGKRLQTELSAKLIVKHGAGHMSGPVDKGSSCTQLPEVVSAVI